MAAITLKNIPDPLYRRIKQSAARNHRSINSEILYCLEILTGERHVDADEFIERIASLNSEFKLPNLTNEILRKAKSEGRS